MRGVRDIFDRVRELASEFPEAEESTHYGTPAFKVGGKMFARLHDKLGDVLVVRVAMDEREAIMAAAPDKFFITPHYDGYPAMLVRLPSVSRDELREALARSWRFAAPAGLVKAAG
jgi:hypothetical protein